MSSIIIHGDCLEELKKLEDCSVDAIVTDPPYGLSNTKPAQVADVLKAWVTGDDNVVPEGRGFMGKSWDGFVPPPAVWKECMRVLKPGGHMAVFAGARTQDLMGLSIRLAGFEIRDGLSWITGEGFPKGQDLGKATGSRKWDGWNSQLKPAQEPIILARKPFAGTLANNVLAHGVGGLNIDASRVQIDDGERDVIDSRSGASANNKSVTCYGDGLGQRKEEGLFRSHASGRFPANVLLDEHAAKEMDEQSGVLKSGEKKVDLGAKKKGAFESGHKLQNPNYHPPSEGGASRFFPVFKSEEETPETKGRFPANVLLDEHAAAEMDEQSGITKSTGGNATHDRAPAYGGGWDNPGANVGGLGDTGGASRFFPVFKYQAKAPKKERPVIEREDGSKIQHVAVKPLALMEWLVTLITPPGGVVLDPFAGSGTTLQAAINKGFTPIGIEQEADYIKLIEKRLEVPSKQQLMW